MPENEDKSQDPKIDWVSWASGFSSGESSVTVDWAMSLDDILPEDVDPVPSQVAAYIQFLQAELDHATSDRRIDPQ